MLYKIPYLLNNISCILIQISDTLNKIPNILNMIFYLPE